MPNVLEKARLLTYTNRMATVLEIRGKSGKVKRVQIIRGKAREFEENEESQGKVREFKQLSERKSLTIPRVQTDQVREISLRSGKSQGR